MQDEAKEEEDANMSFSEQESLDEELSKINESINKDVRQT